MSVNRQSALASVPPTRPNWRLDALKKTLRIAVAQIERHESPVVTRKTLARLARLAPPPFGSRRFDAFVGGVRCRWFVPRASDPAAPVIVHFHGGGFAMCSVRHTHEYFLSDLARTTGCRVLGVEYRKAPEYPFPVPVEDCLAAYRGLLADGLAPEQIVLSGDSAGGNLALAVGQRLRTLGLPMPLGMVLMSPWVDLEMKGQTLGTHEHSDYITRAVLRSFVRAYVQEGSDAADPLVSPCNAEFSDFPPMLVQVGGAEAMLSEVRWMVCKAQSHGCDVRIQEWPGQIHAFQGFSAFLPEALHAMKALVPFLDELRGKGESTTMRLTGRRPAVASGVRPIE